MKAWLQFATGSLMAILFGGLILGSVVLALMESGQASAVSYSTTEAPPILEIVQLEKTKPAEINITPGGGPLFYYSTPASTSMPTLPAEPACPPQQGWQKVVLQDGETIAGLAEQLGISAAAILAGSCLEAGSIKPGVSLNIPISSPTGPATQVIIQAGGCSGPPARWIVYIIQPGDTLSSLSMKVGASVSQLVSANCLQESRLFPGQHLFVPRLPQKPVIFPTLQPGWLPPVPVRQGTQPPVIRPSAIDPPISEPPFRPEPPEPPEIQPPQPPPPPILD